MNKPQAGQAPALRTAHQSLLGWPGPAARRLWGAPAHGLLSELPNIWDPGWSITDTWVMPGRDPGNASLHGVSKTLGLSSAQGHFQEKEKHSLNDKLTWMHWEQAEGCWRICLPHKASSASTRSEGEKGKVGKGEERCQEDGERRHGPAGLAMINSQLNWVYVSLHYPSDRNDGLAHLPFVSGKFSLHPVYYELAGVCLIAFASATPLAEITARLLLQTRHCKAGGVRCAWLLQGSGEGGYEERHSATRGESPTASQASGNPKLSRSQPSDRAMPAPAIH